MYKLDLRMIKQLILGHGDSKCPIYVLFYYYYFVSNICCLLFVYFETGFPCEVLGILELVP